MSYQYDEKYSLLENIGLNKFNGAIKETDCFKYEKCGEYEILNLISFRHDFGAWHRYGEAEEKIGQIILKKGCEPVLNIGGDFIHMTPVIAQRCEQLLYEYKLQQNQSENTDNDPEQIIKTAKQIIKTEQSRNIYKLCYAPEKIGVLNAQKTNGWPVGVTVKLQRGNMGEVVRVLMQKIKNVVKQ